MKSYTQWSISKVLIIVVAALFLITLQGCFHDTQTETEESEERRNSRMQIVVSIAPQKYFVEKIGGKEVNVTVMVEKGANPATYEPKPEQMKAVEQADAYISIGVPFEDVWLTKFKGVNPGLEIFDQGEGVPKLTMSSHLHEESEQHTEEDTETTFVDPHIWLSPKKSKKQAENISYVLKTINPSQSEYYQNQFEELLHEIDELDFEVNTTLQNITRKEFLIFHPSLGYFADDYGLIQIPIEIEGKEPSPKEIEEILHMANEKQLETIFVQEQFSQTTAKKIADEIGGTIVLFDPLAEDWKDNMITIAELFTERNE